MMTSATDWFDHRPPLCQGPHSGLPADASRGGRHIRTAPLRVSTSQILPVLACASIWCGSGRAAPSLRDDPPAAVRFACPGPDIVRQPCRVHAGVIFQIGMVVLVR
jgi:hypothetical protein